MGCFLVRAGTGFTAVLGTGQTLFPLPGGCSLSPGKQYLDIAVQTGVRQGCVLAPSLFSACVDWIIGQVVRRTSCGVSFGDVRITDLDYADNVVILAETKETLPEALETLSEESEPLGLRVSWIKTKIQAFGDV